MANMNLTSILERLNTGVDGDRLYVGDMIRLLEDRGFGPLLLAPALVALLPTGAVPGVPTVCGVLIACVALQLVLGRDHPWMPKWLRERSMERSTFQSAYRKCRPVTQRIDKLIHPRLERLTRGLAPRVIAVVCVLLGLTMIPLEVVPFAGALPAGAIVLMALGLSTHDGLLVLLGLVVTTSTIAVALSL